jgi:uncharacterized membrane protein YkvA (DUF1232 family)
VIDRLKRWARELKAQLVTLWFCRSHPGTPLIARISAALVLAYAFSPVDLIPDFIPVLGYLDDLIIVPAGIYLTLRLIPEPVKAQSRLKAEAWIAQHRTGPKNYFAAAIIVLIWLAIAYWAWKELMS